MKPASEKKSQFEGIAYAPTGGCQNLYTLDILVPIWADTYVC